MARNYRSEYDNYHSKKKAKKQRARNNKARRAALRAGKVKKGSKMDVAHSKAGARGSTSLQSRTKNRSFKRTAKAKRAKRRDK